MASFSVQVVHDDPTLDPKIKNNLLVRQMTYIGGFLAMLLIVIIENIVVLLYDGL